MTIDPREALKEALNDPDKRVRVAAAKQLDNLDLENNVDVLLSALESENKVIRLQSVYLLTKSSSPKYQGVLEKLLKDPDPDIKSVAVQLLGENKDENVRAQIEQTLYEPYIPLKITCVRALSQLGGNASLNTIKKFLEELINEEDPSIDLLIETLQVWAKLGDNQLNDQLSGLLDHSETDVRQEAFKTLLSTDTSNRDKHIENALSKDDYALREIAVLSLGTK